MENCLLKTKFIENSTSESFLDLLPRESSPQKMLPQKYPYSRKVISSHQKIVLMSNFPFLANFSRLKLSLTFSKKVKPLKNMSTVFFFLFNYFLICQVVETSFHSVLIFHSARKKYTYKGCF